jgi:hypothetical protein
MMTQLKFVTVLILTLVGMSASALAECAFPIRSPVETDIGVRTMFVNECGQWYQVGYRIEGDTLVFPTGGRHQIKDTAPGRAEAALREAYGLIGNTDALVRTRW